nr:integrase [Stenotrophomonas pavanii]
MKTDVSNRVVPLHPDLIKLGFLDYVAERRESGDWRLFPQADSKAKNGAGNWISKAFSYYLQKHGGGWPKAKRGFHSLRKTVIQEMQGSGVASEMRAQIVGHELDDEHHATYSRPFTVSEKLNGAGGTPALGVLDYGIDLEALRTLPARKVGRRSSNAAARSSKVGRKGSEPN